MPTTSIAALSGNDTLQINGYVFADFADDNVAELTYASDIAAVKTGKNGNSLYALNTTGNQAELKLRIVRGSADDQFLLGLLNSQQNNFAGFTLMTGQFVKKIGDGQGNLTSDTYNVSGGVFTKIPEAVSNVSGETTQSVTMYTLKFSNAPRTLS